MSKKIINDFSITVGTVNGSGSQTANITILRALFKMGIPVSGKNLFPSNIQGQPTWYTIRVNKNGFTARCEEHEIVVAMNPNSFMQDLAGVLPGGIFFYNNDFKYNITRDDIYVYPMPVNEIIRTKEIPPNLRDLVANMVYVGILAQIIGIDLGNIRQALDFHFQGKQTSVDLNFNAAKASAEWAAMNLEKKDPYYLEQMTKTNDLIMADGNTAAALGAIYGGVQFVAWYPITPASSLAESINDFLPMLRRDENGKDSFVVVQAEDELAAIGMAIGAGWAGLRSMTSTSGPGLSLMTEFAGLAYYTEVPVVIWDVQRLGPSTGLPTRTSQGDLIFTHFMGHGDTEQIILLPGTVNECFEFGWKAFDIAERLQTPVFVLSDLELGMNQWMTTPFKYPDLPMDRGKVLWEEDLERLKGNWKRYLDVDGDGIPYRTIPGNRHPKSAYFLRGTGHNETANYSEDASVWKAMMERLKKKYQTARKYVPKPIISKMRGAKIGIVAYGSTDPSVKEARHLLKLANINSDFLRLRSLPFTNDTKDFIEHHNKIYIIETNRDGQLHQLLKIEYPKQAIKLFSIASSDGLPATAKWITDAIIKKGG